MSDDAIRTFLGELIDDAGLFPPARLSMADAVASHAAVAGGESFWIAGRFIIPASRSIEFARMLDDAPAPLGASVIADAELFDAAACAALAHDAALVANRIIVEAIEVPLSRLAGVTNDERIAALHGALTAARLLPDAAVYVETRIDGDDALDALRALHRARERGFAVCAKIRCGGLDAAAVPSVDAIAAFLWEANRLGVPFKATAGLHDAVRHFDAALGTDVHGFLNLVGGAILTHARGLDRATLATLLHERDAAAFSLDARRFAWRGIGANASEIAAARATFVHSYGSCSFDEPVHALHALEMLPQASVKR